MKNAQTRNVLILALTLVVIMLGFGIVIPVLPFYAEQLGATGRQLGMLMAIYAGTQLVFAPLWGSVSDRAGRRPVLMIGIFGNCLSLVVFGLAQELWLLFLARALSGILSSATFPTAMAFVGDSMPPEERGKGMGILGAAIGAGLILGPGIGGWLGGKSISLPFLIAAALAVVTLILIYAFLPESLPSERRKTSKLRTLDLKAFPMAIRGPLGFLFFMAFLISFGLTNFESVFGLYALDTLNYGPARVGTILTLVGVIAVVVQGFLLGFLTKRFGEPTVIKATLIAGSVGFALLLMARTYSAVLLTTGFLVLSIALLRPSVLSLISKRTPGGQGASMGLANSFMSLGRVVGPIWAGSLFDVEPTYPYLTGAAVLLLGFAIAIWQSWRVQGNARALAWVGQPSDDPSLSSG
jgi:DHA1 family multidrug resistance protein-like MFS transporter